MRFHHSDVVGARLPEPKALVGVVRGIPDFGEDRDLVRGAIADARRFWRDARQGETSIRARPRVHASTGSDPTHDRCAAEVPVRRSRKHGDRRCFDPPVDLRALRASRGSRRDPPARGLRNRSDRFGEPAVRVHSGAAAPSPTGSEQTTITDAGSLLRRAGTNVRDCPCRASFAGGSARREPTCSTR